MKTIFFIRHAKSSWADMSLADIKRPLNKRGLRDAPFMSKLLRAKAPKVDVFISSNAVRAFTTATYFAEEYGLSKDQIQVEPFIYHTYAPEVLEFITKLDDKHQTICLFGHNPTLTSLANHFSSEYISNVPTCGIVRVECSCNNWTEFSEENSKMTAFYYPKQYFE